MMDARHNYLSMVYYSTMIYLYYVLCRWKGFVRITGM